MARSVFRPARRLEDYRSIAIEDPRASEAQRILALSQRLLESVTTGTVGVPMLPDAAAKVLAVANDPSAAVADIEKIVRTDPVLAARVLGVANSARYGAGKVGSLKNALARLGSGTVRDVLYEAVANAHIFHGPAGSHLADERDHGLAVGHIAKMLCDRLGVPNEGVFACGLLHDLGYAMGSSVLARAREPMAPVDAQRVLRLVHPRIGAAVVERWSLPSVLVDVCLHHHDRAATRSHSPVVEIVATADRLAIHLGRGRKAVPIDLDRDDCFRRLGLGTADLPGLVNDASQAIVGTAAS